MFHVRLIIADERIAQLDSGKRDEERVWSRSILPKQNETGNERGSRQESEFTFE